MRKAMLGAAALALLASACGGSTVHLVGGPRNARLTLSDDVDGDLRPRVSGSSEATRLLDERASAATTSYVLAGIGLGFLVPCLIFTNPELFEPSLTSPVFWTGIGSCGVTVVLNVVGLAIHEGRPGLDRVLESHNRQVPQAPWYSTELGVPPPPRPTTPGVPPPR